MASTFHIRARLEIAQQACDLEAAAGAVAGARGTAKVMLLVGYTPAPTTHDLVDNGGAGDPVDCELSGIAGYTGAYGGSGRKAVSSSLNPAWARDNPNTRIEFTFNNPAAWTLATGATIGHVGLIVEDFVGTAGNDTQSLMVAADDTNDVPTNGGTVTYEKNAEGVLQI